VATKRSLVPVTDTFQEVEKFIQSISNGFLEAYNLDYDEVKSAAYLGFMQAYKSYVHKKGEFTTWVGHKVKRRLLDLLNKHIKDGKRPLAQIDLRLYPEKDPPDFDVNDWLDGLSKDARIVAKLVLKVPIDIRVLMTQLGEDSPGNWRQAIREFLDERGWAKKRVTRTLIEIKEAL